MDQVINQMDELKSFGPSDKKSWWWNVSVRGKK